MHNLVVAYLSGLFCLPCCHQFFFLCNVAGVECACSFVTTDLPLCFCLEHFFTWLTRTHPSGRTSLILRNASYPSIMCSEYPAKLVHISQLELIVSAITCLDASLSCWGRSFLGPVTPSLLFLLYLQHLEESKGSAHKRLMN